MNSLFILILQTLTTQKNIDVELISVCIGSLIYRSSSAERKSLGSQSTNGIILSAISPTGRTVIPRCVRLSMHTSTNTKICSLFEILHLSQQTNIYYQTQWEILQALTVFGQTSFLPKHPCTHPRLRFKDTAWQITLFFFFL